MVCSDVYVGMDVSKDRHAVAVAEGGRVEPGSVLHRPCWRFQRSEVYRSRFSVPHLAAKRPGVTVNGTAAGMSGDCSIAAGDLPRAYPRMVDRGTDMLDKSPGCGQIRKAPRRMSSTMQRPSKADGSPFSADKAIDCWSVAPRHPCLKQSERVSVPHGSQSPRRTTLQSNAANWIQASCGRVVRKSCSSAIVSWQGEDVDRWL